MRIEPVKEVSDALLAGVQRLAAELGSAAPPLTRERLQEIVSSDSCRWGVAYGDGDGPVGMVMLASYRSVTGRHFWIEDFVVAPEVRGQGVGEALVHSAVGFARAAGADAVDLTCRPERESANRLYGRVGFQRRETNVYRFDLRGTGHQRGN